MLLDWLAQMHNDNFAQIAANKIDIAVDLILEEGKVLPRDLGGEAKTRSRQ